MFTIVAKTNNHSRFLRGVQDAGTLVKSGKLMPVVFPGGDYQLWSRMRPEEEDFTEFLSALGQPGDWSVKVKTMLPPLDDAGKFLR